jgi:DegV family protein with EDD domain
MHEQIAVLTDTNSGITPEQAARYGIYLVAMPVIIDDETYFENESIFQEEFFQRLREGACVSTSQPAPGMLMDCWEKLLEHYDEIIYLPMSSGLSGGCQTATMLAEEYGGSVNVVDNHRISVTLRQSVLEAKHLAGQGKTAQEIVAYLEKDGLESSIYVAVNTLEYLKKSGRVTAAGAAIGTILNLKPVLQIQGGKLDAFRKARGMRQAMQAMIDGLKEDQAERFSGQKLTIRAAYSGDAEAGAAWQAKLQKAFPEVTIELDPLPISISCHTGEGALGVGMMKDIL